VDRFSDGNETNYRGNDGKLVHEDGRPRFQHRAPITRSKNAGRPEITLRRACFVGGNLQGLTVKLGYLKRLGITTVWVGPVFKQRRVDKYAYHGYAIQNFTRIDHASARAKNCDCLRGW